MKKIYVAGPLSDRDNANRTPSKVVTDYLQNIHKAVHVGRALQVKGWAPYIPAADFAMGIVDGTMEEDDYRNTSYEFLQVCDAIFVIGFSYGVRKELELVPTLPVYFFLEDVPDLTQK